MFNLDDVEATLDFGKLATKKSLNISLACMIIEIVCAIIIFAEQMVAAQIYGKPYVLQLVCATCIMCCALCVLQEWERQKMYAKKIAVWLTDAVEGVAQVRRLDLDNKNYQKYTIEVKFVYEGKQITKISRKHNLFFEGLPRIFDKYNNQVVNILYSPKYDQVMFLKTKQTENKQ